MIDAADARRIIHEATMASGYSDDMIRHDYWMVRCLYGISQHLPPDGWLRQTPDRKAARRGLTRAAMPPVARWAFAGGTSLTAAWGVIERFSEDIDSNLFKALGNESKNSLSVARRLVMDWGSDHIGATRGTLGTGDIRISTLTAPNGPTFKTDAVIHGPDPGEDLTARCRVQSIIARHLPELAGDYPELGGFELPVVVVPFTAVNKLDALHRRAAGGSLAALALRVRDVCDLGHIAASEHADETRRQVPDLVSKMIGGRGHQEPRPEAGYGSADLYRPGSAPYEHLRDAYHTALPKILPAAARLDPFDEVMDRIAGLDRDR